MSVTSTIDSLPAVSTALSSSEAATDASHVESLLATLARHGPFDLAALRRTSASEQQRWIPAAAPLLDNRVELLGGYGLQHLGDSKIDWMHAPGGDWQWPTHLSRHYWLAPLAYAYFYTREERYAAKVVAVLVDWLNACPFGTPTLPRSRSTWSMSEPYGQRDDLFEQTFEHYVDGPWTSLSAHTRFDWWSRLLQLIHDSAALDDASASRLLGSLLGDHVTLMLHFPRRMNQYQGIANSLVTCGWYYPASEAAAEAEEVGWGRLERWSASEIYPDGSLAECSPNYGLGCVMRLYETAAEAARRGNSVPPVIPGRLDAAARYLASIADPVGRSPRIAKGGGLLTDALAKLRDAGFGRDHEPALSTVYKWAGHAVARTDHSSNAMWVFFDAGPRGSGHHDVAQLNVHLKVGDHHILADPGFCSYSREGEPGRLAQFLGTTAAHNCALIDGNGQVTVPSGEIQHPNAAPGDYPTHDDGTRFWTSSRYTYGFGAAGEIKVTHQRTITLDRSARALEIVDSFLGNGDHECTLCWQLHPTATDFTSVGDMPAASWRVGPYRVVLQTHTITTARMEVIRGDASSLAGWYSAKYGERAPSTALRVTLARSPLPLTLRTTLQISDEAGGRLACEGVDA